MEAIGIVRNLDDLGRVTIPIEIRKCMGLKENDPVDMFFTCDGVLIRPHKEDIVKKICEAVSKAFELDKCETLDVLLNAGIIKESEVSKYAEQ